jgi:orotidine-5'-phosphate decarboxylase
MAFTDKLLQAIQRNNSLVCLGLDPDPGLMPLMGLLEFNKAIVDATSDLVCAYKPNLAFYEALGIEGLKALEKTLAHVPSLCPTFGILNGGPWCSIDRTFTLAFSLVT